MSDLGSTAPVQGTELRTELIATSYRHKPTVLVVSIIGAVIMTVVVWGVVRQPWPAVWMGAIVVVALVSIVSLQRYRRHPAPGDATPLWAGLLVASAASNGIVWGTAGYCSFGAIRARPGRAIHPKHLCIDRRDRAPAH